jgi:hypothetical protein
MGFFRRKPSSDEPESDELYQDLRTGVLHTTPDNFSEEFREAPILALLWEAAFPQGVGTLLGGVDGHVAFYVSTGGGIMGNWTSPGLTEANTRWLEMGVTVLPQLSVVAEPPPPGAGMVQFVAVTQTGLRSASAAAGELDAGRHTLSPFHRAAVEVFEALNTVVAEGRQTQGG